MYVNGILYDKHGICSECGTFTLDGYEPVFADDAVTFTEHDCR